MTREFVLEQIKEEIARKVAIAKSFDPTFDPATAMMDIIEKGGKRAQVGEIREWNGKKYQKTANGWAPVKTGSGQKGEGKPAEGGESGEKGGSEGKKLTARDVKRDPALKEFCSSTLKRFNDVIADNFYDDNMGEGTPPKLRESDVKSMITADYENYDMGDSSVLKNVYEGKEKLSSAHLTKLVNQMMDDFLD